MIAESYGKRMFSFVRRLKLSSEVAVPFRAVRGRSCCSTLSPAFGVVRLDFGHSNRCAVASRVVQ